MRLLFWTFKNFKEKRDYMKKLKNNSIEKYFLDKEPGISKNSFLLFMIMNIHLNLIKLQI